MSVTEDVAERGRAVPAFPANFGQGPGRRRKRRSHMWGVGEGVCLAGGECYLEGDEQIDFVL